MNDHGLRILLVNKYILLSQSNLTAISAEIEVFLNSLTIDTIDQAIFAFKKGIKSNMLSWPVHIFYEQQIKTLLP